MTTRLIFLILFILGLWFNAQSQAQIDLTQQLRESFQIARQDTLISVPEEKAFEKLIHYIAQDRLLLKRYAEMGNQYRHLVARIHFGGNEYQVRETYWGSDLPYPVTITANDTFKVVSPDYNHYSNWNSPLIVPFYPRNYRQCTGDSYSLPKILALKFRKRLFPLFQRPMQETYVKIEILQSVAQQQTHISFQIPKAGKRALLFTAGQCGGKKELAYWWE